MLVEFLIVLLAVTIFAMIIEDSDNSLNGFIFPEFLFTKAYLFTIMWVVLAEIIFYAIKFVTERAKIRWRAEQKQQNSDVP
jgi:predicted membrane protein